MKVRGVIKGKTIELDEATDLADGQQVDVDVRAAPEYSGPDSVSGRGARLAPEQPDFDSDRERRYEAEFPATIYVETPVVGSKELMRAVRAEPRGHGGRRGLARSASTKYTIELALMENPPFSSRQDTIGARFTSRTPCAFRRSIYGEDLMRVVMKEIGIDESETEDIRLQTLFKKAQENGANPIHFSMDLTRTS